MGEPQSRKRKLETDKLNNNKEKDLKMNEDNDITESYKKDKENTSVENPAVTNTVNEQDKSESNSNKAVETSNTDVIRERKKKAKKNKSKGNINGEVVAKKAKLSEIEEPNTGLTEEMLAKYPVLKDEDLVKRFLAVNVSNNQKGRMRSAFKLSLQGTSEAMLPEVIHTRMQAILKTPELADLDLRKLRILYNMLKTAVTGMKFVIKEPVKKNEVKKGNTEKQNSTEEKEDGKEKKPEQKVKGPKRYVVFIGNLPLDISKDKILEHFSDLSGQIINVRIPKPLESKKSSIAYLEVKDEVGYELALSKHHSMLNKKRINVLYSTQKNTKISKAEAKGKAAKLVAMQKSGQLAGSVPLNKKRSARRKKMKLAQKKAQEEMERGV